MLRFVSKQEVFNALDANLHTVLGWPLTSVHLKTWQDLAVFQMIQKSAGLSIAEVGGGNSRLLHSLKGNNRCMNVDRFEGADGGPPKEIIIEGVRNVKAFMGEFTKEIPDESLDLLYSISVVEHVPEAALDAFMDDSLRVLKPGGMAIHAIDMYIGTEPSAWSQARLDHYKRWITDPRIVPIETKFVENAIFHSSMASNPDLTMWSWSKSIPSMRAMREVSQSTSLLLGFHKKQVVA